MYFVYEFNLIPSPAELAPLQELIASLMAEDAERFGATSAAAAPPPAGDAAAAATPSMKEG